MAIGAVRAAARLLKRLFGLYIADQRIRWCHPRRPDAGTLPGLGQAACRQRRAATKDHGTTMNNPFSFELNKDMVVTTTPLLDGYRITKYLGIVRGLVVRAPTITQGIMGGLKGLIGGNIGSYTEMCEQARHQAYTLMLQHAREMQANGIIGMHYDATEIGGQQSSTEVLCYGTAVILTPVP
jgi:uncharacterized protein YbjQ (UPF0145 family)